MTFPVFILSAAVTFLLAVPGIAGAQAIKVGVLPYADATASGWTSTGSSLGQMTQAEIIHATQLEGRVVDLPNDFKPGQLDSERIIALGKQNGVDMIVMGTVLEAHCDQASGSSMPRTFFGQTISANLYSYRATVTIQAEVYDVSSAKKLDSFRVTQTQTDKKLSGTAWTSLGSTDISGPAFQTSTIGKALQKTIADLVRRIDSEKTKLTQPNTSGTHD